MAIYPYYPTGYANYGAYPYYQQAQNPAFVQQAAVQQSQQAQAVPQMQQATIQNSGFVVVPSEDDVRAYPVAPGNSITFKIENSPVVCVKTMGFSQLDSPTIERYRLVKEDEQIAAKNEPLGVKSTSGNNSPVYALKSDLGAIWSELEEIKERLNSRTAKKKAETRKEEEVDKDDE